MTNEEKDLLIACLADSGDGDPCGCYAEGYAAGRAAARAQHRDQ